MYKNTLIYIYSVIENAVYSERACVCAPQKRFLIFRVNAQDEKLT